jgi:hypothetical protein
MKNKWMSGVLSGWKVWSQLVFGACNVHSTFVMFCVPRQYITSSMGAGLKWLDVHSTCKLESKHMQKLFEDSWITDGSNIPSVLETYSGLTRTSQGPHNDLSAWPHNRWWIKFWFIRETVRFQLSLSHVHWPNSPDKVNLPLWESIFANSI